MVIKMSLITIHTVRRHPGSTLEELTQLIYQEFQDSWESKCLLENDSYKLKELLNEDLTQCIEQRKDGKYYPIVNAKTFHRFHVIDLMIRVFLEQAEQVMRDEAKKASKK